VFNQEEGIELMTQNIPNISKRYGGWL